MKTIKKNLLCRTLLIASLGISGAMAQEPPPGKPAHRARPHHRGGFPGMMHKKREILKVYDKDKNGRLDLAERATARKELAKNARGGFGFRGFGRPGGGPPKAQPGEKLSPKDVKSVAADVSLFAPKTLRTLFLTFENKDWEKELVDFHGTDVDVPASLVVDGKSYPEVGVRFRGKSSYMMIPEGSKRPLNISINDVHKNQRLYGHKTLNLLNSVGDPTFLRALLYSHIAREYIPAPKMNYLRLVVNGEDWGIYISQQQFNKVFLAEAYGNDQGARWKVPGSPMGRGSLAYLGKDYAKYQEIYTIKSEDRPESWAKLLQLCKVLNETPPEKLEKALDPLLDVDGVLRFLAIENALINTDGYWARVSDYSIGEDSKGVLHIIPHDMNEGFTSPHHGPGHRRGKEAQGGKFELNPLVAASDEGKPLISKLLAVPSLRKRYLAYVRDIAQRWLDWKKLGPLAESYQAVIAEEVKKDHKKLFSTEKFKSGVDGVSGEAPKERGHRAPVSLKDFADQRRAYLLKVTEPK